MSEDKVNQTAEVKIDEIYDGPLDYEALKNQPILQPIAELASFYEGIGLLLKNEIIEFDNIQKEINTLFAKNQIYSKTIFGGQIMALKQKTSEIIFNSNLMIANLKRAIKDMILLDKKYKTEVVEKKEVFPLKELDIISKGKGRPKKEEIGKNEIKEIKEEVVWDGDIKESLPEVNL
jgi:hypothetical protein